MGLWPVSYERMFGLFEQLNAEQRSAVTHHGGPLRILAGAGTGKTTTLSARVAWLIAGGVPPERVLLLTFTRRAARQMLARTATLLAEDQRGNGVGHAAHRVQGGTFHAVAHRTLRRYGDALGIPEGFSILDPADAADVLDLVREEQGHARMSPRRFPRKALLLDIHSTVINTGRPLSAVIPHLAPWASDFTDAIAQICRAYMRRKRAAGLLDFDDLLLYWRAAVQDDRLGPRLARAFDHILVDEYQDANGLQVDVLRALRGSDQRLTVVGDDAQSLYSFRAAEPRHILDFPSVFPDTRTVVLCLNYRSGQPILDVANAVGADAPEGFSAVLRAARTQGARPQLHRCADEDAEVMAVSDRVLMHREEGIPLHEQAVLMRAAHHSSLLELELGARHIPYVKYGGIRFLEASHVKDLLAAFRLADNPRDVLAWFRLLQLLDGVGPSIARRVIDGLGLGDGADTPSSDAAILDRWTEVARILLPAVARDAAQPLIDALHALSGDGVATHAERLRVAIAPLVEATYSDSAARLADLDALVAASSRVARLTDVAADYALEPPASTANLAGPPSIDEDWLVLSTVHSAKGLEWDVVHVLHATDGNIPSDMALQSAVGLEEERRVFYVAVTRARKALHVYLPLRYHHHTRSRDDSHSWAQPSRFISTRVRSHFDDVSDGCDDEQTNAETVGIRIGDLVTATLDGLWE